ncbi:PAS domain-containing protein [Desulfolithobacter dissulfuricans]|nr:PAS domain-containing protein [Desulfolithobacter dissulfuricans]
MQGRLRRFSDHEPFLALINLSPDIICFKDGEGRWLLANTSCLRLFGLESVEYSGKRATELAGENDFCRKTLRVWEVADERAWQKEELDLSEEIFSMPDGEKKFFEVVRMPLFHPDGRRRRLIILGRDVTSARQAEIALRAESRCCQRLHEEIQEKNELINKVKTTIDVLLERNEAVQKVMEQRIATNLQERILPYLELLRSKLSEKDHYCLDIIATHIDTIGSSFIQDLKSPALNLTPREIQLADLVMQGRTNKEIADLLNISVRSVESYRYSLRKKLGLRNKKINLRTYLLSSFSS